MPLEDVALEDFDLLVQHCADRKQQSLAAEVTSILAGVAVDESAAALDADLVAWYATATAVFPAETEIGGHIHRLVPTTTVPQPPPGRAEITEVKTAAGGILRPTFTAAHGTRFTVLHQGPGDTAARRWWWTRRRSSRC